MITPRKFITKLPLLGLAIAFISLANAHAATLAPEIEVRKNSGAILTDGLAKVDFGMVTFGTSAKRVLVIRNVGTAPLTGIAISKTGISKGDFTIIPIPSTTLAPGAEMSVLLFMAPTSMGTRTTTIHIKSNDTNENLFDIHLVGTGMGRA